jgi:hypothetical protein
MDAFQFGYAAGATDAQKAANALALQPLVGEVIRRTPLINATTRALPKAPQVANNAMKYLGAAGAGLGVGGALGYGVGRAQNKQAATGLSAVSNLPSVLAPAAQTAGSRLGDAARAAGGFMARNPLATVGGIGTALSAGVGAYDAPQGKKLHGALSGAARYPAGAVGGALGYGVGAVTSPLAQLEHIGKNVVGGARMVGQAMDRATGGGRGAFATAARVPGQAIGAIGGGVAGLATSPVAGLMHIARNTIGGMDRGERIMDRITRAPYAAAPAAKQAGVMGDVATSAMNKGKQLAGKANDVARAVANKGVDMGKKMENGFEQWRKGPNPITSASAAKSAAAAVAAALAAPRQA